MGRHALGWTVRLPEGRNVWLVRFQHEGRTVERSTGERDRGAATRRAAQIYSEIVSGRVAARPAAGDLVPALALWLEEYEKTHTKETALVVEGYLRGFAEFFGVFARLTPDGYAAYARERAGKVSRSTLRKELSALRLFAEANDLPEVPGLPKRGHEGTRGHGARRRVATILSPNEVQEILDALPVRGPRSGGFVRPFFVLAWETGLRPFSTIARLRVPLHFKPGAATLFISREIDKAKYERTVPLSPAARNALELVARAAGAETGALIFPDANESALRASLAKAVAAAKITKTVSIYDLRHSRISQLANSGAPLAGVSFLVGHKFLSTTSLYVTTSEEAAAAALSWGGNRGALATQSP